MEQTIEASMYLGAPAGPPAGPAGDLESLPRDPAGRFTPLSFLGSGAFGLAVLAQDAATGELVAVKFIQRGAKVRSARQLAAGRRAGRGGAGQGGAGRGGAGRGGREQPSRGLQEQRSGRSAAGCSAPPARPSD